MPIDYQRVQMLVRSYTRDRTVESLRSLRNYLITHGCSEETVQGVENLAATSDSTESELSRQVQFLLKRQVRAANGLERIRRRIEEYARTQSLDAMLALRAALKEAGVDDQTALLLENMAGLLASYEASSREKDAHIRRLIKANMESRNMDNRLRTGGVFIIILYGGAALFALGMFVSGIVLAVFWVQGSSSITLFGQKIQTGVPAVALALIGGLILWQAIGRGMKAIERLAGVAGPRDHDDEPSHGPG